MSTRRSSSQQLSGGPTPPASQPPLRSGVQSAPVENPARRSSSSSQLPRAAVRGAYGVGGPSQDYAGKKPSRLVETPPAFALPSKGPPAARHGRRSGTNPGSYEDWMANHKQQHVKAVPVYELEDGGGSASSGMAGGRTGPATKADPWDVYRPELGNRDDISLSRIKNFCNAAVTMEEFEKKNAESTSPPSTTTTVTDKKNHGVAGDRNTTVGAQMAKKPPHLGVRGGPASDAPSSTSPQAHLSSHLSRSQCNDAPPFSSVRTAHVATTAYHQTHHPTNVPPPSQSPPSIASPSVSNHQPAITKSQATAAATAATAERDNVKRDRELFSALVFLFRETLGCGKPHTDDKGRERHESGIQLELFADVSGEPSFPHSLDHGSVALGPVPVDVNFLCTALSLSRGQDESSALGALGTLAATRQIAPVSSPGRRSSKTPNEQLRKGPPTPVDECYVLALLAECHHKLWRGLHNIVFHFVRSTTPTPAASTPPPPNVASSLTPMAAERGCAPSLTFTPAEWLFTLSHLADVLRYPRLAVYSQLPPPLFSHKGGERTPSLTVLQAGLLELVLAILYVFLYTSGDCHEEAENGGKEGSPPRERMGAGRVWWVLDFAEEVACRRHMRHQGSSQPVPLTTSLVNPSAWPPGIVSSTSLETQPAESRHQGPPHLFHVEKALAARVEQVERLSISLHGNVANKVAAGPASKGFPSVIAQLWGTSLPTPLTDHQATSVSILDPTLGPLRAEAALLKLLHSIHSSASSLALRRAEQVSMMGKHTPEDFLLCSGQLAINEMITPPHGDRHWDAQVVFPCFNSTIEWLESETSVFTEEALYLQSMLASLERSHQQPLRNQNAKMRASLSEWCSCCAPVRIARSRRSATNLLALLETRFTAEVIAGHSSSTTNFFGQLPTPFNAGHHTIASLLKSHHGYILPSQTTIQIGETNDTNDFGFNDDCVDEGGMDSHETASSQSVFGYASQAWAHTSRAELSPSERRELLLLCPHLPQDFQEDRTKAAAMESAYYSSWLRQQLLPRSTHGQEGRNLISRDAPDGGPLSPCAHALLQTALSLTMSPDCESEYCNIENHEEASDSAGRPLIGTAVSLTDSAYLSGLLANYINSTSADCGEESSGRGFVHGANSVVMQPPFRPLHECAVSNPYSLVDSLCVGRADVPRSDVNQECCVGIIPSNPTAGIVSHQMNLNPADAPSANSSSATGTLGGGDTMAGRMTSSASVEIGLLKAELERLQNTYATRGQEAEVGACRAESSHPHLRLLNTSSWRHRIRDQRLKGADPFSAVTQDK